MLDCDGTRHGPPMSYASSMKPTEVSDWTEIKSNIKLDEKYLKGYHWYAWSLQSTGWGSSQAHEARQSLRYICQQVLLFLKATNVVLSTEVESQTLILLHQVSESCAVLQGIFSKDILEELCWLWHIESWSLVQMLLLWTWYLSNLHQQWYNNVENKLQERILVMFSCHRRKCVPSHIYIILLHVPHPNIRVS